MISTEILFSLLAFAAGGIIGESIAYKAFGVPKNSFIFILDIILFVFLISLLSTYIQASAGFFYYSLNFFIAFFSITIVRGIESIIGLTYKTAFSKGVSLEIIQALAHAGLEKDEIIRLLRKMGYTGKDVEKHSKFIEKTVPPYLPKIVRMESVLERIESKIDSLEKEKGRKK